MRKYISILILCVLLAVSVVPAYASTNVYPSNAYRIVMSNSSGTYTVYIPYNYGKYFALTDSQSEPINEYSSRINVLGYSESGTQYQFRFPTFGTVEYRRADSSAYTYFDFNGTSVDIDASNVPFLNESDFTIFSRDAVVNMSVMLLLGCIWVALLFLRR